MAGIVVLSDGGDTSNRRLEEGRLAGAKVFPVGVGTSAPLQDREVVNVTAGEPLLPEASIDLSVSAVSRGFGTDPVELRVSANGRPVEIRRVIPAADGAPIHEVFTVSPAADQPTVYTVDIPGGSGDRVVENNRRSVLVPPQAARRKVLMVEGAPGFEHTFLKRALAADLGLDVDSVVRKGQNDDGRDTFFVQAGESRAAALSGGYPVTREALFQYDAIIFGNVEADFFTRDQLDLTARFVAERGGGLLVLGARSFERQGLTGTPLEEVLPVDLTDRRATMPRPVTEAADGRRRRGGQRSVGDARWRRASGHAPHRHRGQQPQVVAAAAGARLGGAGRRAASRCAGPGGDGEPRRRGAPADRGAALRSGPDDDLRRRGVVALAHDAPGLGYRPTTRSGVSWCAGWRPPPPARCRSRRWRWPCRAAPNR